MQPGDRPEDLTNITIRQKEIEYKISKLKGKKATGPDGVPKILLKSAGKSIALSLKKIFEHSIKACKPPVQWKIARVSAAFKKGREEDNMLQTTLYASLQNEDSLSE